jgi:uncharacterized protein YjbI with pentapeptide repeats
MEAVIPKTLAFLPGRFKDRQGHLLVLCVYACFPLENGSRDTLFDAGKMWSLAAQALGEDNIFDQSLPKPRAEVLVYGACQVPTPAQMRQASFRLGSVFKALIVRGDSEWRHGVPSTPEPFTSMDISWGKASGGPDYSKNPAGLGRVKKGDGRHPIPNVSLAGETPSSPGQELTPASFCALPPNWPQRTRFLGAFDREWRRNDFPHPPASTDPRFYMTAPEDQWLPGYLDGDEQFRIENMHADKPLIASRLPGLRARVFVTEKGRGDESFREVRTNADTVWLFPNLLAGVVRYCGMVRVNDDNGEDLEHLLADFESMSQPPLPDEYYRKQLRSGTPPEEAAPPSAQASGSTPESRPSPPPAPEPEPPTPLNPLAEKIQQELNAIQAEARTRMASAGVSEQQLSNIMSSLGGRPSLDESLAKSGIQDSLSALRSRAEQQLADSGLSPESAVQAMQQLSALKKQPGLENLEALVDRGELPEQATAKAREALAAFAAISSSLTKILDTPPPTPQPEATAEPPQANEKPAPKPLRSKLDFKGDDLTGRDFTNCDLAGANFKSTILEQAKFDGANLEDANFTDAVLTSASFRGADCTRALFTNAKAGKCDFRLAKLHSALMKDCELPEADLSGVQMSEAVLDGAFLHQARLLNIQAPAISAVRADFSQADMSGASLRGATLKKANFSGAKLDKATLYHARAEETCFNGASAKHIRMRGAYLEKSTANNKSCFHRAHLRFAHMAKAQWRGVDLTHADMRGAILDDASFSRAVMNGTVLKVAIAKRTDFSRAELQFADMRRINLFKGSLRNAKLRAALVKMANLYGVDLAGAVLSQTRFDRTNLKRTLIDPERFHGHG